MKRILIITNIPSPYRVEFFDELCRYFDVTVVYAERSEDHKDRNAAWYLSGDYRFHAASLEKRISLPGGQFVCPDVLDWLKKPFDEILMFGYAMPTFMLAEAWLSMHGKRFYLEIDGGILVQEPVLKRWFKRRLIGCASGWFSTGRKTNEFLTWYNAKPEKLHFYPFSSVRRANILPRPVTEQEKADIRAQMGIPERNMILAVGQFIPRKGFDVLLRSAAELLPDTGIYFVGGEPTQEYRELAQKAGETKIHFVSFCKREELELYYKAADVFVLPTREDIWGLVINEAMAYGLPIVTTDRCVAGLELVENGVNGWLVPVEDTAALTKRINQILRSDLYRMGEASLEKIRPYTIEGMAEAHRDALG